LAALRSLAQRNDPKVVTMILERWRTLGPSLRREAAEVLFARPQRLQALLDALAAGSIAAIELDPARRDQLLRHPDPTLKARAARLLANVSRSDRSAVVARYRLALELTGDPTRGREVYRKNCATCHVAQGQGTAVGPDLVTVRGKSPDELLALILDPNREVAPPYVNYTVATTDGQVFSGLVASESAQAVTLKRAEGVADVLPRSRIEAITSTGQSLMPENFEATIDNEAMADLIAFVRGLN
jgi:putative heme-binding domain-containing protein